MRAHLFVVLAVGWTDDIGLQSGPENVGRRRNGDAEASPGGRSRRRRNSFPPIIITASLCGPFTKATPFMHPVVSPSAIWISSSSRSRSLFGMTPGTRRRSRPKRTGSTPGRSSLTRLGVRLRSQCGRCQETRFSMRRPALPSQKTAPCFLSKT
jgi:hypothetical protein